MSPYSDWWHEFTARILRTSCNRFLNFPSIFRAFQNRRGFLRNKGRTINGKLPHNSLWYKHILKKVIQRFRALLWEELKLDSVFSFAADILYDLGHRARGIKPIGNTRLWDLTGIHIVWIWALAPLCLRSLSVKRR